MVQKMVQNHRIIRGKETAAFQIWIEKIQQSVANKLVPIVEKNNMLLPKENYTNEGIEEHFTLAKISNFNSLIALSQEHGTPVYALTPEQLGQTGIVLKQNQNKQREFEETFSNLADKIIQLSSCDYAVSG